MGSQEKIHSVPLRVLPLPGLHTRERVDCGHLETSKRMSALENSTVGKLWEPTGS